MPAPRRYRLLKRQHIRDGKDFEKVYAARNVSRQPGLLVFGIRNGCDWTRFGLSVSRKHGGAVVRNRLKRLLREAFRLEQFEIPIGLDLVLVPQQGTEPTLPGYRVALVRAARSLSQKLPPREDSPVPTSGIDGQDHRDG